jgi:hypothetical protein
LHHPTLKEPLLWRDTEVVMLLEVSLLWIRLYLAWNWPRNRENVSTSW